MKENQQILNGKISEYDSMVKSPVLERVKRHPIPLYQKDNILSHQEYQKYISIIPLLLPLRKAPALRFLKYDLREGVILKAIIVRSSCVVHGL